MDDSDFLIEQLPRKRRALRIAIVTETYPPDANDVALAAARLVEGLRRREHEIQLARPRLHGSGDATGAEKLEQILTRNMPVLKLGLPATKSLVRLWSRSRPDVVHVLTRGPLAWSALSAARRLRLPVVTEFRARLADAAQATWLSKPLLAYLRKFHNRALWTFVPTEALCAELAALGFRNLRVVTRHRWDLTLRQLETLFEIAAGIGIDRYSVGERRARVCVPQGT